MNTLSKKKTLLWLSATALFTIIWVSWDTLISVKKKSEAADSAVAVVEEWYGHALHADRFTEGFRAPVAARAYAYIGLAAWEASLVAFPENKSLAAQFPDLHLPKAGAQEEYHLPSVLNACYHTLFEKIFLTSPRNVEKERNDLKAKWMEAALLETDSLTLRRSLDYGKQVALAVFTWSATDTIGHMSHLHNFDKDFSPPAGVGFWQPCADFPTPALLPNWSHTRTFVARPEDFIAAPLPPFSIEAQSPYYLQALEVYTINNPLSDDNQWIAEFWSDDHPGLTFSSAGRWVSIAKQVIDKESPPADKVLETYLRLGFAMSDAIVACWRSKYEYNLLRPETFIRMTMQADWRPILHTPPFPSYPSGHAMSSAAAAEVLTQLYGDGYAMTDHSHDGRTEFKSDARSYDSFYEMAAENAFSRIALGVHFKMDCEEGTRLGLLIGKEAASLPIRLEKPLK